MRKTSETLLPTLDAQYHLGDRSRLRSFLERLTSPFDPGAVAYPGLKSRVFVCGCGHSGTTIITRILAHHPSVFCPPQDTGIFTSRRRRAAREFRALEKVAVESNKTALVEKTPRHIREMALIRELVRDPRFLLIVRDGRDVIASFARRAHNGSEIGRKRWLMDNAIVAAESASSDTFVMRYEDFVADSAKTIEAVCKFANLTYSDDLLSYHQNPQNWFKQASIEKGSGLEGDGHLSLRNWQVNQPIFDGRGRWRNELTEQDIELLRKEDTRHLMQHFGYW